jgi:hypothetical protein
MRDKGPTKLQVAQAKKVKRQAKAVAKKAKRPTKAKEK